MALNTTGMTELQRAIYRTLIQKKGSWMGADAVRRSFVVMVDFPTFMEAVISCPKIENTYSQDGSVILIRVK